MGTAAGSDVRGFPRATMHDGTARERARRGHRQPARPLGAASIHTTRQLPSPRAESRLAPPLAALGIIRFVDDCAVHYILSLRAAVDPWKDAGVVRIC
jgi:hypothetical protein